MQVTLEPIDPAGLRAAWETFVTAGQVRERVDPLVALSWRRSLPRLNPRQGIQLPRLSEQALQQLRINHFELIAIARPFMEDIHQFVEGLGYVVVLLDASACVLEILGDPIMLAEAEMLGLSPGTYWDEGHAGTNAFGLALLQHTPIQVVGAEHFVERFHELSAAAAPVYDAEGQMLSILGMAGRVHDASTHLLGIVHAAARAVENQLQTDKLLTEMNTQRTGLRTMLEAISDGVIGCDAQGLVTQLNTQAAQILGLSTPSVLGRRLEESVNLPAGLAQAVQRLQPLSETEMIFEVNGHAVSCLVNLVPVSAGGARVSGFILTLRRIEQVHRLVQRMVGVRANVMLSDLAGSSPAMQRVRRQAQLAARGDSPVLLEGESGTGKYVLAHAIHNESAHAAGPFVAISCRAVPRDLILSEFLGREDDPYGRVAGQPSKFELAQGGTLHLQEVEALPLDVQAALLRVLETREVLRLGGTQGRPVDVRFIASTAVDLERAVSSGEFRADLYFALSPIVIELPPLRERPGDLAQLAGVMVDRLCRQSGRQITLSRAALRVLPHYHWPGNVRELEAVLERAATLAADGTIEPQHLPAAVRGRARATLPAEERVPTLRDAEREAIVRAAWACRGNVSRMSTVLGIGRTSLWRKMRGYGMHSEDFRDPQG